MLPPITFDRGVADVSIQETIGASALHAEGITGAGVGIAVIDTGVNAAPDLDDRLVVGPNFAGDGTDEDAYGHGTFIAGVAAMSGAASEGEYGGIAPGSHVIGVKCAGADGAVDVAQILAALHWVTAHKDEHGIGVVNLSFGTDGRQAWDVDPLNFAVEQAWKAGIVVVTSAGNRGPRGEAITKPGDDPWVITVGATDLMGDADWRNDVAAEFTTATALSEGGYAKPDVVAPGVKVIGLRAPGSTIDRKNPKARRGDHYFRGSGTSFSAAAVAGAAALLRQARPGWDPDRVKNALLATAVRTGAQDSPLFGLGTIDVAAAARAEAPGPYEPPDRYSTGEGNLQLTRGGIYIRIGENILGPYLDYEPWIGKDTPFDQERFLRQPWDGHSWEGSQWHGHSWEGHSWEGHSWEGAWYGHSWEGHSWEGHSWEGHAWE